MAVCCCWLCLCPLLDVFLVCACAQKWKWKPRPIAKKRSDNNAVHALMKIAMNGTNANAASNGD